MRTFYEFLMAQEDRDKMIVPDGVATLVEDLASEVKEDSSFPKNAKTKEEVKLYLENRSKKGLGLRRGVLDALNEAWKKYEDENNSYRK